MSYKHDLVCDVSARRKAALAIVKPQWKACFWTRPFGHIRDGSTARDVVGSGEYYEVCLYCGKPVLGGADKLKSLESVAETAGRFPIALGVTKSRATA